MLCNKSWMTSLIYILYPALNKRETKRCMGLYYSHTNKEKDLQLIACASMTYLL
jgi:hypothetical protein